MTTAPATPSEATVVDASHVHMPRWIAVGGAVFFGTLNALQSRIQGELGARMGDGFAAAFISFSIGFSILVVAMLIWPAGRRGLGRVRQAVSLRSLSIWHLLGGTAGAFYVLSQSLTASLLGVALFTVAIVAGQTVSGLVMDWFGVGPGGRRPLTAPRVIGAVIALVAVGLAVSGQLSGGVPLWLMAMPLVAGFGQGWQHAVNGRVKAVAESALTSTFLNFLFGAIALGLVFGVHALVVGLPQSLPTEPWLYLGGLLGCIFIAGGALVVRTTGVLLLGLGLVAGQLLCALALEIFLPTGPAAIPASTIAGTLLALVAVFVVGIRWRSANAPAATDVDPAN